jgi:hypothetical protein
MINFLTPYLSSGLNAVFSDYSLNSLWYRLLISKNAIFENAISENALKESGVDMLRRLNTLTSIDGSYY